MASHSLRPTWRQTCLHGGAAVVFALLLWFSGQLRVIEARTFDLRANLLAQPSAATGSIVLVTVDQEALDWVAEEMGIVWPWPRELFAAVIDNCNRRGARAIGFDVLFTEDSAAGVADDQALARAMAQTGAFALGSVFPTGGNARYESWPEAIARPKLDIRWTSAGRALLPAYPRASMPIGEIGGAAGVLCNVHHAADPDGIYRRLAPLVLFDDVPLPNLGIGVYLAAHPGARVEVGGDRIVLDGKTIPLDAAGAAIPRFRGPHATYRLNSAAAFIRQEFQLKNGELAAGEVAQDLAGKYVLFGYTARGLYDLRPSPTDGGFSGVEINATVLDNLLADDFIRPIPPAWTIGAVVLFTVVALLTLSLLTSLRSRIFAAAILFLLPMPAALLLYRQGFDFALVPVQLAVMAGLTLSIVQGYFLTLGQERFIRHSFKHYLSPVVIDQLLAHPDRLKLGGERKELTMFFSDLQGFTRMSEGMGPEGLIRLLNEYLTEMTGILLEEGGTVDKFVGDAIVAFWNAPLENPGHAEKAVRAALRCQARLVELAPHFRQNYGQELVMRIGINTGQAVAGNMGSSSRFNYTVRGDEVNLAARLEGANKYFGTRTMISQATFAQLGTGFTCRELGRLRVVGRREPVTVFEPLSFAAAPPAIEPAFARGLQLFYGGRFAEAGAEFSAAAADPAAAAYVKLCEALRARPPERWDGIFDLKSK